MLIRKGLGQIENAPGTATATPPPSPSSPFTLTQYFLVAVAAGITVWFVTRILDRK